MWRILNLRYLKHALLNDVVQLALYIAHQLLVGEEVRKPVAQPQVQIQYVEHRLQVHQVDNGARQLERPATLIAQPVERDRLVAAVPARYSESSTVLSDTKISIRLLSVAFGRWYAYSSIMSAVGCRPAWVNGSGV
uniref:Uncharacterized protein n=1 Tax=Anopheles coluzzii TaxID=1518534 RepID=A0A8W7PA72_ANOCL